MLFFQVTNYFLSSGYLTSMVFCKLNCLI